MNQHAYWMAYSSLYCETTTWLIIMFYSVVLGLVSTSASPVWDNQTDRRWWVVCGHPRRWIHSDWPPLNAPSSFPCFLVLEMSSSLDLAVALLCPFIGTECWCQHCLSPTSLLNLLHLCLYLSLLLKMLSPSPVPQGSSWWKNKAEGKRGGMEGQERSNRGKGEKGKEGAKHLTWRQEYNFSRAALFKVKAWFAFQKRRPAMLPPQGRHRTNQRVI